MGNAKAEDPPKRLNDGLLYFLMDRHMWIYKASGTKNQTLNCYKVAEIT